MLDALTDADLLHERDEGTVVQDGVSLTRAGSRVHIVLQITDGEHKYRIHLDEQADGSFKKTQDYS